MHRAPSRTALRVALRRAAHQIYDTPPLVFEDPLAVRILGPHASELARTPAVGITPRPSLKPRTHSFALRAFLVARSRYTEDALAHAVTHGLTQYVLLGAGLDTFAHRNPHPHLRVFELDHPATQTWKRTLLADANLPHPANLTYLPADLEPAPTPILNPHRAPNPLTHTLLQSGLDPTRPTFFAALGVVPYLTPEAFHATLRTVAAFPPGSALVFDYALPRAALTPSEQLAHDSVAARVRALGEPFRLFFTPSEIATQLHSHRLRIAEDLDGAALNALYFNHRPDALRLLPTSAHLLHAQTT